MPPKKAPAKKKESKNPENGGEMVRSFPFSSLSSIAGPGDESQDVHADLSVASSSVGGKN
jgi:hypothetical protein